MGSLKRMGILSLAKFQTITCVFWGIVIVLLVAAVAALVKPAALFVPANWLKAVSLVVALGIIGFISGLAGGAILNLVLKSVGGIEVQFGQASSSRNSVLKRIGVSSFAKLNGIMGIVTGVAFGALSIAAQLLVRLPGGLAGVPMVSLLVFAPLLQGLAGLLGGALLAFLYNAGAKMLGGVGAEFERVGGMSRLNRFDVGQMAKMLAFIAGVLGVLPGVMMGLVGNYILSFLSAMGLKIGVLANIGGPIALALAVPIISIIAGLVGGALGAINYNMTAKSWGGLMLEFGP